MLDKLHQLTASHGELRPGRGLVSGVIALGLAALCFLGVLAFHFPEYRTTACADGYRPCRSGPGCC